MANDKCKVKIVKHSFTQTDMFDHLKMVNSIGLKHAVTHDKYGCESYKSFCGKVFAYFFFLIILRRRHLVKIQKCRINMMCFIPI